MNYSPNPPAQASVIFHNVSCLEKKSSPYFQLPHLSCARPGYNHYQDLALALALVEFIKSWWVWSCCALQGLQYYLYHLCFTFLFNSYML